MVEKNTPKFNPHIVKGLACEYVPKAEAWVHQTLLSASRSFPDGLVYHGYERCNFYEEYEETTKISGNKRSFELAESDLYMVKYLFSFKGESLPPRYMYLPYVREAGLINLSGTLYHITGVLCDKIVSPGSESIFVRLIRDKIIFLRQGHTIVADGRRQTVNTVWSNIYRKSKSKRNPGNSKIARTLIAHYLFARFGFYEAFQQYAGFRPVSAVYDPSEPEDPNVVVCRSTYYGGSSRPASYQGSLYSPTDICLKIPRQHWNDTTAAMVAGFFYVVDNFPDRFRHDWLDDTFRWRVILGHIIFSGAYTEAKLNANIEEHFASLDDYMDQFVIDKLKEIGWEIHDFYGLIAKIMVDFPRLLLENPERVSNMYHKNIEILYYMLSDITHQIFTMNYQLRKQENRKPLTAKAVISTFTKSLTKRVIFKLHSNSLVCETVSYCGDHMYPKITSRVSSQDGAAKGKRVVLGPNHHLNASAITAGSVLFLSKSNPDPSSRLNPYGCFDLESGTVLPNPKYVDIIADVQARLSQLSREEVEIEEVIETSALESDDDNPELDEDEESEELSDDSEDEDDE